MDNVKMLLIDVKNSKVETVIPKDYKEYHELLDCDVFDVTRRFIGENDKCYEFVCDDMGLLKNDSIISALNGSSVAFVGNLLIAGQVDTAGDFTSLNDDDIAHITSHIKHLVDISVGTVHPVLVDVHY